MNQGSRIDITARLHTSTKTLKTRIRPAVFCAVLFVGLAKSCGVQHRLAYCETVRE